MVPDPNVKITSGTKVITYQYDELNQLIRENNGILGTTVLYAYDAGGNMTSRKTYAYTEGTPQTLQKTRLFRTELMAGRISWYPGMATAMSMMQVEIRPYYEAFR